jgi:hypothetical protein
VVATETRHMTGEDTGKVRKGTALFGGSPALTSTPRRPPRHRLPQRQGHDLDHRPPQEDFLASGASHRRGAAAQRSAIAWRRSRPRARRGRAAAGAIPDIELRETEIRAEIQGIPCREVQVSRSGERIADVCRASYADAGVSAETFAAVREVQELLQSALGGLVSDEVRSEAWTRSSRSGARGHPAARARLPQGEIQSETLVTSFSQRVLGDGDFAARWLPPEDDHQHHGRGRMTAGVHSSRPLELSYWLARRAPAAGCCARAQGCTPARRRSARCSRTSAPAALVPGAGARARGAPARA